MKKIDTKTIVLYAFFVALVFLLGLTPVGYIYLPIAAIITVHIPVIIGADIFGVKGGALLGVFFGLTSLIQCFMAPDAVAAIVLGTSTGFGLYNILLIVVVLFLPRILVGVFSALTYKAVAKKDKHRYFALGLSGFVGSMTNTVFLLGGLYVLAFKQTAEAFGVAGEALLGAILGVVALNGLLEAGAAVVLTTAVGKAIITYRERGMD